MAGGYSYWLKSLNNNISNRWLWNKKSSREWLLYTRSPVSDTWECAKVCLREQQHVSESALWLETNPFILRLWFNKCTWVLDLISPAPLSTQSCSCQPLPGVMGPNWKQRLGASCSYRFKGFWCTGHRRGNCAWIKMSLRTCGPHSEDVVC